MGSGFSALTAGMSVRGADAHRVGAIKEIHATDVLIQRRLQPTVHVPLEAIRTVTASEVVLGLTTGEVDELYWMHAGEDFDLNLRGIYKYDYMHP